LAGTRPARLPCYDEGTEAMHKTIVAPSYFLLGLALLIGISSIGCKSMPKNPWAKSAAMSDPAAPALAHTAPTKPSALAKQAEGLASVQIAGGEAAPFVPSVNITGPATTGPATMASTPASSSPYPTTTAPSFMKAAPVSSVAMATPTPSTNGGPANSSSIKLPYDPSAVPPAILSQAEEAIAAAEAAAKNRYANVPTPTVTPPQLNNLSVASVEMEPPKTASRYGGYSASVKTAAAEKPKQVAAASESLAAGALGTLDSRYAQAVAAATNQTPPAAASSYAPPVAAISEITAAPETTTPTPMAVASTAPYRPGGTTSYPAMSHPATMGLPPGIEIATRPDSPVNTEAHHGPNVGTPASGEPTVYPVTPQTPRYR